MGVIRTKTFKSGNSEAVRLPKEVAFGENVELIGVRSGDVLTLYPAGMTIAALIAVLKSLPAPPSIEPRDVEIIPERDGL